jgi:flagellar biosynthesis/type III secretory pathway M-ring protein FliF/YscJ
MSTGAIIAIVVAAVVVIAIFALLVPRMRARSAERRLNQARGRAAEGHREVAAERMDRARLAETEAQRERAEAELHQARAHMHEEGRADEALDEAPEPSGRFDRDDERQRTS